MSKTTEKVKEAIDQQGVQELPVSKGWLSTGCTLLDLAITNRLPGGIARGRITRIYGGESTGKSIMAATLLGSAQRHKMIGFYGDIENTFDPVFAKLYGLNPDDKDTFRLKYPRTIEELFDTTVKDIVELKDKRPKLFATDSVTALPSKVEVETKMEDATYGGTRAKQIGLGLRKYIRPIAEKDVTLVLIDQTRDNISKYGPREITSGGRAIKFYASTGIYLQHDDKVENSSGKVIGIWVKFQITKNKVSIPFREGRFKILFDYGIDDVESNLYFLKKEQLGSDTEARKKGTLVKFDGDEKKIPTMIRCVEDNNLERLLEDEVVRVWDKIHATEKRKQREWNI